MRPAQRITPSRQGRRWPGGDAATSFQRHGFAYQVAGHQHDAEIARLLNDNEVPGWISLSYRTQPGSHRPLCGAVRSDTIIGFDAQGRAGGIATRSIHTACIEGRVQPVGWLGQLRIDKPLRHRAHLLRAGFEAVERFLHDADETPHYYASIIEGNEPARRILEKGLEGFPKFEPLFGYRVLAISTGRALGSFRGQDIYDTCAFINSQNRDRDLAVHLDADEIVGGGWIGLTAEDVIVLRDGLEIVAAAVVWDQHPCRSIRVAGYREPLGWMRGLLNLAAPLTGLPRLPSVGEDLRQAYLSLPAVKGDDPALWIGLVRAGLCRARAKGAQLLALGFSDSDPAAAVVAQAFRHRVYRSTIYRVSFGENSRRPAPPLRNPKVEIGLL